MAQRMSQGFRPTETVQVYLRRKADAGERKTDTINRGLEVVIDAAQALGPCWWDLLRRAEAEKTTPGTLLGRLALAGLKGAKR